MLAGLVGLAFAAAPEHDALGPRLVVEPIVELRPAFDSDLRHPWGIAGRGGVGARRGNFSTRLSLQLETRATASEGHPPLALRLGEGWVRWTPPISEALGASLTVGVQPVRLGNGRVLGDDDLRLLAERPAVAVLALEGAPLYVDVLGGFRPSGEPFAAGRLGAGRTAPGSHWQVDALGYRGGARSDREADAGVALVGEASVRRIRAGVEGHVQPTDDVPQWQAGAQLGVALGDDSRVVLSVQGQAQSERFLTTYGAHGQLMGQLGLFERSDRGEAGAQFGRAGTLATLRCDATLAPSVRVAAAGHYVWAGGEALGPELDADARWYWSPLAALRLRGAVLFPWSSAERVTIQGAVSIDVRL